MPIFFQQDLDDGTRLGVWKIEEDQDFFLGQVMPQRDVTHPHKKLQHLAGRYLLRYLFPNFPVALIQIADTRKPFLADEAYHFSISHCGNYAAAIVSKTNRVGIDIEIPTDKILKIEHKFLHEEERLFFNSLPNRREALTLVWCMKESMFKWWGNGNVDFSEMLRIKGSFVEEEGRLDGTFLKDDFNVPFPVHYKFFPDIVLTWVTTGPNL